MRHQRARRVALFSHDSQGLGHTRRNIEIAAALVRADPHVRCLLVSGAPAAGSLALPPRTTLTSIPAVRKDRDGTYLSSVPGHTLAQTLAERGARTTAALTDFDPDVVVVDKHARGLQGELDGTLATLAARRAAGAGPALVLGLRDVLDDPATARREWDRDDTTATVLAHYDQVWVYGDPRVHDPVVAYGLDDAVAARVRHTGYLSRGRASSAPTDPADDGGTAVPARPFVLGLLGGGQDGAELAGAFARASSPTGYLRVLVTGPYLDQAVLARLQRRAESDRDLLALPFVPSTQPLLRRARAVVTMGGYNTVCEVLETGTPMLVVPRTTPRREQQIRAEALAQVTHVDVLHPALADADALGGWLAAAVRREAGPHAIDLDGLSRLPHLLDQLLEQRRTGPTPASPAAFAPATLEEPTRAHA